MGSTGLVLSDPVAPVIRKFVNEKKDVLLADIAAGSRAPCEAWFFCERDGDRGAYRAEWHDFDVPRKRDFRTALNRAARLGYTIAECSVASLPREELKTVSERWRRTRSVKNREMTFLTRPAVLDDEVDVRKFFSFDHDGRLNAFAFFDPIYENGDIIGYLCSAKRRLPDADALVGYAILHRAIRIFQNERKRVLSFGLLPLCGIENKGFPPDRLLTLAFRLVYRSPLFNKLIYPLRGYAAHKGALCGSAEQAYCAFNRGPYPFTTCKDAASVQPYVMC